MLEEATKGGNDVRRYRRCGGGAVSGISDVLDPLVDLAGRAESYPSWARALFLVTLVLVLASVLVYVVLFPRVTAQEESAPPVRDSPS
jgi:hypothetical protein